MKIQNKCGAVLITTLWIITILTALCISVAHRSAITLKLASYQTDKVRAYMTARSAIIRALAIKNIEYEKGRSLNIDAFSEPWANDPAVFKRHSFNGGLYTLSYPAGTEEFLYGLCDEASRLNINKVSMQALARLMTLVGVDETEADSIAYCILDWRDEDNIIGADQNSGKLLGAEDEYYKGLENPYPCKNAEFQVIEELLLVKGLTPEIFNAIKDLITVYTDGKVNINTASDKALSALFGYDFEQLSEKIINYRKGRDEIAGTQDDRWFSTGPYIVQRGEEGLVEVKNLSDGDWLGNIYGIATQEYNRIKALSQEAKIATASNVYRATAEGEYKKVISRIEAVYEFKSGEKAPVVKFWHTE